MKWDSVAKVVNVVITLATLCVLLGGYLTTLSTIEDTQRQILDTQQEFIDTLHSVDKQITIHDFRLDRLEDANDIKRKAKPVPSSFRSVNSFRDGQGLGNDIGRWLPSRQGGPYDRKPTLLQASTRP